MTFLIFLLMIIIIFCYTKKGYGWMSFMSVVIRKNKNVRINQARRSFKQNPFHKIDEIENFFRSLCVFTSSIWLPNTPFNACLVMFFHRELRCLRNTIHINLFLTYILWIFMWILTLTLQVKKIFY